MFLYRARRVSMSLRDLFEALLGAEDLRVAVHRVLQLFADRRDSLGSVAGAHGVEQVADALGRVCRAAGTNSAVFTYFDRVLPGTLAEHVDVEQRIRAETVGAVHTHARALAGRVEPGNRLSVLLRSTSALLLVGMPPIA